MACKKKDPTPVLPELDANRHHDTRKNIPTEDLRDFVADDEAKPPKMLYPRDPSLDPQLVWKGKDEQDREPLEVDIVPIYIQEVIEPRVIVDAVLSRKKTKPETSGFLPGFFDDFEAMEFDRKIEFYQHDQKWANRMILGNSLHVMTSLAEKEGLKGKVQMIYIDPPYGINYGSNWQVSSRNRDVKDNPEDVTRQPEQLRAFRDTWTLGIHSYLNYIRDRLVAARELLTETGSLMVQTGTENLSAVGLIMDEVLGSQNKIELISFRKKTMPLGGRLLEGNCDYILWYAKDKDKVKYRGLFQRSSIEGDSHWNYVELPGGERRPLSSEEIGNHKLLLEGSDVYQMIGMYPTGSFATGLFDFTYKNVTYKLPPGKCWKTPIEGMHRLAIAGRLQPYSQGKTLRYVLKHSDYPVTPIDNVWQDTSAPSGKTYVVQTSNLVVQRCVLMTTDPGDLVLDPTCGSGTTAYVAEQWGRRWITIDTSRVALALARTRVMAARFPYYYLADSCPQMTQIDADNS